MEKEHTIIIEPDGSVKFIYYDELQPLLCGKYEVKRKSHIDPKVTPDGVKWFVDLTLSNGPVDMGPYDSREEAIVAEVQWLLDHLDKW